MRTAALALVAALCGVQAAYAQQATLPAPWLPLDPGHADCQQTANAVVLRNAALRFELSKQDGGQLKPAQFENGFVHATQALDGQLFSLNVRGGKPLSASQFQLDGAVACSTIAAIPNARAPLIAVPAWR